MITASRSLPHLADLERAGGADENVISRKPLGAGKIVDWAAFWRELVVSGESRPSVRAGIAAGEIDLWRDKAREYDARAKARSMEDNIFRESLISRIDGGTTVLDIGAGTGRWALYLARRARKVTALEPSPAMLRVLTDNVVESGLGNLEVISKSWPQAELGPHDVTLCAHAMYSAPDLPGFVRRMVEVTKRTCFLMIKSPTVDGVMAEACVHVWGHRHDCPDFTVAYNVLLEMGLLPNVVADPTCWDPWVSPTLEDALVEIKRKLRLRDRTDHDSFLRELLERRLTLQSGKYVWPPGVRGAMIHWDVMP